MLKEKGTLRDDLFLVWLTISREFMIRFIKYKTTEGIFMAATMSDELESVDEIRKSGEFSFAFPLSRALIRLQESLLASRHNLKLRTKSCTIGNVQIHAFSWDVR